MRTYSVQTRVHPDESLLSFDTSQIAFSRPAKETADRPRLVLRKVKLERAYRVSALWPSGLREYLGTFTNRRDAIAWIGRNSKSWRRECTPPATS